MNEQQMRRLIALKRDGAEIAPRTWKEVLAAYLAGSLDDVQMAALLMASVLRGLSLEETRALTEAFLESGETLQLPADLSPVVDKHSSGGVGDTASLIVVPLVSACGVRVAKLSGRALGHTGGTLDKLEAVPGVRTGLTPEAFVATVRDVGCAIAAQSDRFVPADKRIYALRDRTATVPSLGLIAASIVSKKIAGGADAIVYDVKGGNGAFMRDLNEATRLAHLLVTLTETLGRRASALVTDMEEPLGRSIGPALEMIEARDYLAGVHRDPRLRSVCEALAEALLVQAGGDAEQAKARIARALDSGAAAERFEAMLTAQGAQHGALAKLAPHEQQTVVAAPHDGFVAAVETTALGDLSRDLVAHAGAGAGIVVQARTGCAIRAGEVLATVYGDAALAAPVGAAFTIADNAAPQRPLIYTVIGGRSETAPAVWSTDAMR